MLEYLCIHLVLAHVLQDQREDCMDVLYMLCVVCACNWQVASLSVNTHIICIQVTTYTVLYVIMYIDPTVCYYVHSTVCYYVHSTVCIYAKT